MISSTPFERHMQFTNLAGTNEHIQAIQQIFEKAIEFHQPCVICFIHYTKALDSIAQQSLWNALREDTWIESAYIDLLAKLYQHSKTRVCINVSTTKLIYLLVGVKQGGIASAILFCMALMVIVAKTFENLNYGIRIGGERH